MKKIANFSSIFKGYKKYLVVGGVFTIYMLFFDNASFLVHRNMNSELDKLTRQELEALYTDEGKEKLGREVYYLKHDDEEVFIIEYDTIN